MAATLLHVRVILLTTLVVHATGRSRMASAPGRPPTQHCLDQHRSADATGAVPFTVAVVNAGIVREHPAPGLGADAWHTCGQPNDERLKRGRDAMALRTCGKCERPLASLRGRPWCVCPRVCRVCGVPQDASPAGCLCRWCERCAARTASKPPGRRRRQALPRCVCGEPRAKPDKKVQRKRGADKGDAGKMPPPDKALDAVAPSTAPLPLTPGLFPGIGNPGFMCYANAPVQCLRHGPFLAHVLGYDVANVGPAADAHARLLDQLQRAVYDLRASQFAVHDAHAHGRFDSLAPHALFPRSRQHDAGEWFLHLLSEANRAYAVTAGGSVVGHNPSAALQLNVGTETVCTRCNRRTSHVAPHPTHLWELILPPQPHVGGTSVAALLELHVATLHLGEETRNAFRCFSTECDGNSDGKGTLGTATQLRGITDTGIQIKG